MDYSISSGLITQKKFQHTIVWRYFKHFVIRLYYRSRADQNTFWSKNFNNLWCWHPSKFETKGGVADVEVVLSLIFFLPFYDRHSSLVGSKPYHTRVGKTRTLHLHLGLFGRSQKAPVLLIWYLHWQPWTIVPTMNVR